MLLRMRFRTAIICTALFLAAGCTIAASPAPARRLDAPASSPSAQDELKPSELAGLEALSNSFRKLARSTRRGVVHIMVGASLAAKPDPAEVERLRSIFGNMLSDDQLRELARRRPRGLGSGIIFDQQGHILTNSHVVKERDEIEVHLADDRTYEAKLVGIDPKTDVAVIQIDAPNLHPLVFANSHEAEVGDWVLAVGAPFGLTQTVTHGIISATGRMHVQGLDQIYYQNFLQTDAAINPGNSGGPLLNMRGEVLGINTAIATDDPHARNAGVAFAIPSNMAVKVARALIDKGVVARGWLGISFSPAGVTSSDVEILRLPHDNGVLVDIVLANSPALKAGVQVDDYITAVNGQDLAGVERFTNVIGDFQPDDQLKLQIIRDRQMKEITLKLGQQPDDPMDRSLLANATEGRLLPRLGLSGRALRPNMSLAYEADDRGVFVTNVGEDGPCGKAVKPGEVIVAVNDHKVRNLADMEAALKGVPESPASGEPRKIRIDILQRDGDLRLEKVTPR
jgi:serine protease Do